MRAQRREDPQPQNALPPRRARALSRRLLQWYAQHARDLPWRRTHDPYAIWVSEIMLQQTQVETVKPYFQRWMESFPTVDSLASAALDDILRHWEGLGYYSRARHMKRAAELIVSQHNGHFPSSIEEIRQLPGVGPYTAAAIASIAVNVDAAVVDGNVKRVLARVCGYRGDVKTPRGLRDLQAIADQALAIGQAGDYNQAVMDLGATICTPRKPRCDLCPLNTLCVARLEGSQNEIPVATRRREPVDRQALIGVVHRGDSVWIVRRDERLLGGLWSFPSIEVQDSASAEAELKQHLERQLGQAVGPFSTLLERLQHTYTHFRLTARVVRCDILGAGAPTAENARWISLDEIADMPMGRIDRAVADAVLEERAETEHKSRPTAKRSRKPIR